MKALLMACFYDLSTFVQTLGGNGCAGTPKFELSLDNTVWYYWNGTGLTHAAWVVANSTYAEANTASDINAAISTFPSSAGNLYVKAFLQSNGGTPCELDQIAITGLQ